MASEDTNQRIRDASEENVLLAQAKREERGFIVSTRATVTASGGTMNLHIANPSESGLDLNVLRVHYETQFEGLVDVWDAFSSSPSGGSALQIDNLLMDADGTVDEGSMNANAGVSFTGSGTHYQSVIPSGGPGGSMGGQLGEGEPLIEPGREIVIEITNQSGSDDEAAITVVYVEESRG